MRKFKNLALQKNQLSYFLVGTNFPEDKTVKKITAFALLLALTGCGVKGTTGDQGSPSATPTGPPLKLTGEELYDAYKVGKNHDGREVELTGYVRSVDTKRSDGKTTIDGGINPVARVEVFFTAPVSGYARGDTITVKGTIKGKVDGVPVVTEAKLVNIAPKKEKTK